MTFSYLTSTQKRVGHKEARQKTVPQTAPVLQGSENKTSIELRAADH
jgi:hypothetical protein